MAVLLNADLGSLCLPIHTGESNSLASSRIRRMPVPAFSMKPMRCRRSATSGVLRTFLRQRSATVTPYGKPPGLLTSIRSV